MCGIAGFVGGKWSGGDQAAGTLGRMARALVHRGPDHAGTWFDESGRIGFAHDRLAIIDLSAAGNQPMHSHSGRYVIVYNGEIYNHQEIRGELIAGGLSPNWDGHSDTETLLAAIDAWGIRGALDRSTGMFAFAVWDRSTKTLTLARDRLGEKPLYYGRQFGGGPFLFGSELKAFREHPQFRPEVNRDALALLLRYDYIPAPFSIYRGISKLPPGAYVTLEHDAADPVIENYWSGTAAAKAGVTNPLELTDSRAIDLLEERLEKAIGMQMIADVPLGAFLSGGIDSSTVAALMQKLSSRPVKTFTIGFRESDYNEAPFAGAVARHLGTEHTELYVSAEQARSVIPQLPSMYDEPFADASQIPTFLVSALAREHVKVSLSGDGGDELFGGYNRYQLTRALWEKIFRIPKPLRAAVARAITAVPTSTWTNGARILGGMLPIVARDRLGEKMHKGSRLLHAESLNDVYASTLSIWDHPEAVVLNSLEPEPQWMRDAFALASVAGIERMMALDMLGYLPDDLLVKVDRAAMAVSLETRIPFLDHNVVEFALRLPLGLKVRGGQSKWILRQLLYRYVPRELVDRPKMGFGVPIGEWLRGPLRDWAEDLLGEEKLRNGGYFRSEPIRRMWQAHLRGRSEEQYRLWGVLMFQSWLEANPAVAG